MKKLEKLSLKQMKEQHPILDCVETNKIIGGGEWVYLDGNWTYMLGEVTVSYSGTPAFDESFGIPEDFFDSMVEAGVFDEGFGFPTGSENLYYFEQQIEEVIGSGCNACDLFHQWNSEQPSQEAGGTQTTPFGQWLLNTIPHKMGWGGHTSTPSE